MRYLSGFALLLGFVTLILIPDIWNKFMPDPSRIGNQDYILIKTFFLQALTAFFAFMAYLIANNTFKSTTTHNDLSALDEYYRDLVVHRMKNTNLASFDLSGADDNVRQQKIEYAYLMFTFIESIMSRGEEHDDARDTWVPLVVSECKRYISFIEMGTSAAGVVPIHNYNECFREETLRFFKDAASEFCHGHHAKWRHSWIQAKPGKTICRSAA